MKALASILISLLFITSFASNLSVQEALDKGIFPTLTGPEIQPNDDNNITVYLIPHTHDDIGWLKTVDQYYLGSQQKITNQGVQYILDSVFPELDIDPEKRFIYVEVGFFKRWWDEQDEPTRDVVRTLLANKQFEFINGGYCMNDEAAVYYEDSIEQMWLGHQWLLETFNVVPTIGWHIDPFGHAAAQAALFAQMGFNAFYFARIDYQDKHSRLGSNNMETVWIPQTSQGIENAMFTHVNYQHYSNPQGFCFDITCGDDPIMDDPNLGGYNVDKKADDFVSWFTSMQEGYKSSTLMHTAGDDFNYMAAEHDFINYDRLFAYLRGNGKYSNFTVKYATPSEYINATNPANLTYSVKTDDFFPYSDGSTSFWAGYFTSRTSLKLIVRQQGRFLQAIKRLATQAAWQNSSRIVTGNFSSVDSALWKLEEAVSIGQHHDGVTGTSKQAVAENYKQYFGTAEYAVKQDFLYPYFKERVKADLNLDNVQFDTCHLNASAALCNVTQSLQDTSVLVAIYNSGPARRSNIRIKVPHGRVQVSAADGLYLPTDVVCPNKTDTADCDLLFSDYFAAYTVAYYYLVPISGSNRVQATGFLGNSTFSINARQTLTVTNYTTFNFNICQDTTNTSCYASSFNLKYNYYEGYQEPNQQASGAYIFKPSDKTQNDSIPYDAPVTATYYQGRSHLHIRLYGAKTIADIRVYRDLTSGIEIQTFVDSISIDDGQGKEVILLVEVPSINNNGTFYTDSMGMELQERVLNYRPSWDLVATENVAGNYYPVQSTILINDTLSGSGETLAVLPDRAQGGASLKNGSIELMLHRRLTVDDGRGVSENLNETDTDDQGMRQWITHTLLFSHPAVTTVPYRKVQQNNDMPNVVLLAKTKAVNFIKSRAPGATQDNFAGLDPSVKVSSRPLNLNKFLFRFQNMDETVTRNVSTAFFNNQNSTLHEIVETTLTANQAKLTRVTNRLDWNGLGLNNLAFVKTDYLNDDHFSLRPLEIRTFTVQFFGNRTSEAVEVTETPVLSDDELVVV